MDALAYFRGYLHKEGSFTDQALETLNPGPADVAQYTGNSLLDWIRANPKKMSLLAGALGGGVLGKMFGKEYDPNTGQPNNPGMKGAALGAGAAGGMMAYKNRDKIADFFKRMNTGTNV